MLKMRSLLYQKMRSTSLLINKYLEKEVEKAISAVKSKQQNG